MTERASEFLRDWTRVNLPEKCEPSLRVSKATQLARDCREAAAKKRIPEEELTLAGYGNLVVYFQDELARGETNSAPNPDVMPR